MGKRGLLLASLVLSILVSWPRCPALALDYGFFGVIEGHHQTITPPFSLSDDRLSSILNRQLSAGPNSHQSIMPARRIYKAYLPNNFFPADEMLAGNGPEVNPWLIGGEFLTGIAGEIVLGNLGLMAGYYTGLLGYTLGGAIGVYWLGNVGGDSGSFLHTLVGGSIGILTGWLVAYGTGGISFVIFPAIGSVYGFNGRRKMDKFMDKIFGD